MTESGDITDPSPEQQDPESAPAADEQDEAAKPPAAEEARPAHQEAHAEAESLKVQGDKLEEAIQDTRKDWEAKQEDASVPGAVPDPGEDEDKPQAAQSERGEAAEEAGQ